MQKTTNEIYQKIISTIKKARKTYKTNTSSRSFAKMTRKKYIAGSQEMRLNEMIAEVLERLSSIMTKKGDYIRSRAYSKALDTVLSIQTDITSIDELEKKPNIGPTIIKKLNEYYTTGTLALFEEDENNPVYLLSNIYGIGPKKAEELVKKHKITTISQLRQHQDELLNEKQRIGLKYYEDIMEKIPRAEIDNYNKIFATAFAKAAGSDSENASKYEIVGSYRRGAKSSGDIDVIVTSNTDGVFSSFIDELVDAKIIVEILSRGQTKCLVIAKLPGSKTARRVDFMNTSAEEFPFAILYFTGSKMFNTVMRGHALSKELSLNEHGLYKKMSGKAKEEKIEAKFTNEKDIFDYLGLVYKEPEERTDGRAVMKKDGTPIKIEKIQEESMEEKQSIVPVIPLPESQAPEPQPQSIIEKPKNKTRKKMPPKKTDVKTTPPTGMGATAIIQRFKTNGIKELESLTEKELSEIIILANNEYYNKNPLLTDNEYDIIKEFIEKKYPRNEAIQNVGAPVTKNKVTLPYNMPSMDKIKPDTNALTNWMNKYKGPYVISCKLDGVSGMYDCSTKTPHLYTRGDGKIGQNISGLLKHLKLPDATGFVVRGEFIIPRKTFDEKYKASFANPRNLVSGIINSKTVDDKIKDIHFVTYEIISPPLSPSQQLEHMQKLGFEVVQNRSQSSLSNTLLSETLMDWRTSYKYEIDGIIVSDDKIYPRKDGNPEHAFAFKMVISDQMAEAKVLDVEWAASKSGYLKPRIKIEPVKLGGVTIEYCTAFNANFVESNKIGIGAVVQIIRSGDVIPHIKSVTTQAERAKMPDSAYHWNDTHVDIVLDDVTTDETVLEKNITAFFVGLEVDGLSSGNVKRLIKAGFNSVPRILKMTRADFATVEGFKEKMVNKLYDGIKDKVQGASLIQVMAASNLLGRGIAEKKIRPIMEKYPDILTSNDTPQKKTTLLLEVQGIGKEQSKLFVENIPRFLEFLRECELEYKLNTRRVESSAVEEPKPATEMDKKNPLYGKKIVMTKVRDKDIIAYLQTVGGILEDNIKKDTYILIVKSKADVSNKTKFANDNSIPMMEPAEFKEKFIM
jgi:NAD-dependent DNA ligase